MRAAALLCLVCLAEANLVLAESPAVYQLSTGSDLNGIARARDALKQGSIVFAQFVSPKDFAKALGIQTPPTSAASGAKPASGGELSCIVAAYADTRLVRTFVGPPVVSGHRPERQTCKAAFDQWVQSQKLLGADPDPGTWTKQGYSTHNFGLFTNQVNIYRAASDDPNYAYYMYTLEMTDQTASTSVKTCTISMQGLQLANQLAPGVFDYGHITVSPGTPSAIGTFIPSDQTITPYQPDSWSGNASTVAYTGTSQAATWVQQYSSGEGSSEVRVAAALFRVGRADSVSVEVTTQCTDGSTTSSQSDLTYSTLPPNLVAPSDVYLVAGSSLTYSVSVVPLGNQSFDWSPTASNSTVSVAQNENNITVAAPLSALGTTVGINYGVDPLWATTTLTPATLVHVVDTPPLVGALLAGGYDGNNQPLATADVWNANTGQVTPTNSSMSTTRWRHTATTIDATHILITGGYGGANNAAQNSTDIYDVTTGLFTAGPNMNSARAGHTATVVTGPVSGKQYVVLAGGVDQNGTAVGTLDVYDVSAKAFLASVPMAMARWNHTTSTADSQNIVIAGGSQSLNSSVAPLSSTEVCSINSADGISCAASDSGLQIGRQGHAALVDHDGVLYVFGGFNQANADPLNCKDPLCSYELSFDLTGDYQYSSVLRCCQYSLPNQDGRRYEAVVLLPASQQGPQFVFVGGYNTVQQVQSCQYIVGNFVCVPFGTPISGGTAELSSPREYPIAIYLGTVGTSFDKQVLITGGVDLTAAPTDPGTSIEIFNPANNKVTLSGNMSSPRTFLTGTLFQAPAQSTSATTKKASKAR
jgi:hypothetical protein